ncbi:hypothetical protein NPX13_g6726 [Xylaria arbuscula]|uniref:Transmembrane protein n=1 Tax=Xylaria arbuscula TaxID=114810 RepID=A0A9W8NBX2_9PEZI|nr:hypothetical protein NPX13_g6726 [Xylaria arbuscula]
MDQQEEDEDHNAIHMMLSRGPGALYRRREPAELGRDSASACVAACFEKFVPNVQDVCRQLQQPNSQRMYLWSLYCCDFVNCGVYIGDIGQSPNVDLIINECQNIGFPSIEDPGPPSLDYCMSSTAFAVTTSLPPQTWNAVSVTAQVTITPPSDMTVYAVTPGHTASLMSGTFASSPSTLLVPASSTSASSSIASEANTSRLSGGATAAIVIFSVIAVLAITALLLFLFRRQNKGSRSSSRGLRLTPYNNRPYPGPRSASLTHLIPPPPSASSRSAQLTPPAKLSDRKYLQSGRKPDAPRSSASMTGSGQPLPTSPTRALAQSRSKSRHKRGTTTTTTSSHIITPTAAPTPPQYSQGGIHSSNTGPGTSTVPVEPNKYAAFTHHEVPSRI